MSNEQGEKKGFFSRAGSFADKLMDKADEKLDGVKDYATDATANLSSNASELIDTAKDKLNISEEKVQEEMRFNLTDDKGTLHENITYDEMKTFLNVNFGISIQHITGGEGE